MSYKNREVGDPTHIIWQVIGEADKSRWVQIGAGWANRDGKGLILKLDAYPIAGRTVIREVLAAEEGSQP